MKKIINVLFVAVCVVAFVGGIGTAQNAPCSPNPVPCVLDTTGVTSPAVIPEVRFIAQYGDELPVTVLSMAAVAAGQELNVDVPVPKSGEVEILALAFDECGRPSVPPAPISTVRVQVTETVVGSCGLRLR